MKEKFEEQETPSKFKLNIWGKIFHHIKDKKKLLLFGFLVAILLSIIEVLIPFYINKVVFKDLLDGRIGDDNIISYIAIFMSMVILLVFLMFLFILTASKLRIILAYRLRKASFLRLQELSYEYYDETAVGWIMARMTSDTGKLSHTLSWSLVDLVWGVCIIIFSIVIMLVTNFKLGLIALMTLPLVLFFSYFLKKIILVRSRKIRAANSKITAGFSEGLTGINTTKTLALENQNFKEFSKKTNDIKRLTMKQVRMSSLYWSIIIILSGFATASVLYSGSIIAIDGAVGNKELVKSISDLTFFISLVALYFDPIMTLSRIMIEFQEGQASAERVIGLIETEPTIKDTKEVVETYGTIFEKLKTNDVIEGDIEFKDIDFHYKNEHQLFHKLNLKIPKGTSVALVGETGSGKSTLVNLICRFYEPSGGELLIDGIDYRKRSIKWLHSNLGYVLQTPQLFNDTIFENIRYGKLDATEEDVINAAKLVGVHDFIDKLEDKYNTKVGEDGSRLSVGEKQLISFARAIIGEPSIVVLDEATSSIDIETEAKIQNAIDTLLKDRTSFVIAHRLSTIINSDIILVMKNGKITEMGNHNELIALKGYYNNLYESQFK